MKAFRHAATLLAMVVLLAACGRPTPVAPGGNPSPEPSPSPTITLLPTPTPSPSASPVESPPASPSASPTTAPVACDPLSGGSAALRATITDVRVGSHPGYDRLVIEMTGGVPTYRLEPHDINDFVTSFRGNQVPVAGSTGLILHIYNQDMPPVFAHGTDLRLDGAALQEVVVLGDFEGQADLAIGFSSLQCPAVSILDSPPRLVIDFPTAP